MLEFFSKKYTAISLSIFFLSTNSFANGQRNIIQKDLGDTLFSGSAKFQQAISSLNWVLTTICVITCVSFGIKAAKKLSEEQYFGSLGPLTGSIVAGIAGYLALKITS